MSKKSSILMGCLKLLGVMVVAVIVLTTLLRQLQAPELSKEEVRDLLRGVQLPEVLTPEAMSAHCGVGEGVVKLFMRIRVKGDQADELLDTWLQGANRMSSDEARKRKDGRGDLTMDYWGDMTMSYWGTALRDGDVLAFKNVGKYADAHFVLRKRDAGVDIYCCLWNVPTSYVSEDALSVMHKGSGWGIRAVSCERRLGGFVPD